MGAIVPFYILVYSVYDCFYLNNFIIVYFSTSKINNIKKVLTLSEYI